MISVAYITNASPASGVGHRATALLRQLKAQPKLSVREIVLDGQAPALLVDGQKKVILPPLPGPLSQKSVGWIRLKAAVRDAAAGADLVHLTNQSLAYLMPSAVPTVLTVHDLIERVNPQRLLSAPLNAYLTRRIPQANHLVAISEHTKQQLKTVFSPAAPITVIPNGIDATEFFPLQPALITQARSHLDKKYSIPITPRIVLTVSSLHPRKNAATTVAAVAQARQQNADVHLVHVGSGTSTEIALFKRTCETAGLIGHVTRIANVPTTELNELYNCADVFVYPSLDEGFGLPPLQAAATGTPVVTSNIPALEETAGSYALQCDPQDAVCFARAIVIPPPVPSIDVDKHSWIHAAEAVASVYQKTVNL